MGEYKALVEATDSSKNRTSKETTIKIIEPSIVLDVTSKTLNVNETFTLTATSETTNDNISFESSNPTLATVDNDGKVTALNPGNVVIIVKANGASAKCLITIKEQAQVNIQNPQIQTTIHGQVNGSIPTSPANGLSFNPTLADMNNAKIAFVFQNQKRIDAGLQPLQWNEKLLDAANVRAVEITTHWGHTRPNGTYVDALVDAPNCLIGENLAKGYFNSTSVLDDWMKSETHRANILKKEYTSGIIVKYDHYWVALFAGPES